MAPIPPPNQRFTHPRCTTCRAFVRNEAKSENKIGTIIHNMKNASIRPMVTDTPIVGATQSPTSANRARATNKPTTSPTSDDN